MPSETFTVYKATYDGRDILQLRRLVTIKPGQVIEVTCTPSKGGDKVILQLKVVRPLRQGELQAGTTVYIIDGIVEDCEAVSGPVALRHYNKSSFGTVLIRRY